MITSRELLDCYKRIQPFVLNTPIHQSTIIDQKTGASVFFKCENFQYAGAYKIRGATNAILQLSQEQKSNGVVTHSSGNFAQALSLAAKNSGVTAHIVMPTMAPRIKKEGVFAYNGKIYECKPTVEARQQMAKDIADATGATFIHPSNNTQVIMGQGTAAYELLQKHPDVDLVYCPIGGGGLIAGTALYGHAFAKDTKVYGGEPFEADDAYRSLKSGFIEGNSTVNTIADGLRTTLGDKNFPIIKKHVSKIVRVTEEEISSAMRLVWENMKIIIEPSSAVAIAALLRDANENKLSYKGLKVGVVISGGNVDLDNLPF